MIIYYHILENKTLETSAVEDYFCYEVVDEKGCEGRN
jgi:hypothetical protein